MIVHIISVGRSLLDAFANRTDLFGDLYPTIRRHKPQDVLADVGTSTAAISTRLTGWFGPAGSLPEKQRDLIDAVEADRWPANVCAELETFNRVARRRSVADDELVVLLATDTVPGLVSGVWTAVGVAGGAYHRVRYVAEPDQITPIPGVALVRVPHLDASNDAGFARAMTNLGALGRALLPTVNELPRTFRFHLSGGFKAAIPYLIGLAEGLRSFPPSEVARVEAFMLHDTSDVVIPLPLRKLNPDAVRKELADFAPDGSLPRLPRQLTMDGYAYNVDPEGRRAELTPFGVGLRTLMGVPAELIGRG
ncbi:hypothetical protein JQS43_11005 [Natronosporangium hydrolyticum]|uniref:CRISPR-associated protein n=1 Tax=Natronosporangium hydrolyticum TaxID=2811111 RepID=A0A895YFW1_9ACTN|nr:hypothetical protein [Natronosporangium hydrolyticum]QSB16754.1 hypothetical protein JQS43_11005 [Natronosporangium hydrolyticum]